MDLLKKMEQLGANKAQLTSGTADIAIRAIAEDEGVIPDTVRLYVERLADKVEKTSERLEEAQSKLKSTIDGAEYARRKIEEEAKKATENYEIAKRREASVITDKSLSEAVKAYRAVLQATTDVFGKLDKETQIAVINAGSYIAWRGIMGGKFDKDDKERGWKTL